MDESLNVANLIQDVISTASLIVSTLYRHTELTQWFGLLVTYELPFINSQ